MSLPGVDALRELLGDLSDAVSSVLVAGVAFPDPDLPVELRELAARAEAAGLDDGSARALALAVALEVLADAEERAERRVRSAAALERLHELLAWQRLFWRELDLMVVEANLVVGEAEEAEAPTVTRRVVPVGLDLRGERLTIFAVDEADRGAAVLVDTLAEVDRLDPLGRPAISRLFQDRIDLREVLGSTVELVDHPVGLGGRVFAPAFATRPRLVGRAGAVPLPEVPLTSGGSPDPSAGGPGRIRLTIVSRHDRIGARTERGLPVGLAPTPALRTVLAKLLVREAAAEVPLSAVLAYRHHRWALIAADDPVEGRCHPAADPALFGIAPIVLCRRAAAEPGLDGLWLQVAAGLLGGLDEAGRDDLVARVREASAETAAEALRLGLAARMLEVERPADPRIPEWAASGDEGEVLAALWLAEAAGFEGLPLEEMLAARTGPVEEGDLPAVLVRTLLRAQVDPPDGLAEAAIGFLEAHLVALRAAARDPERPLPDLFALVLLGDVLAWLRGADRLGAVVVPLDLPRDRLWRAVIEAIRRWTFAPAPGVVRAAGDALILAAAADVDRWVVAG